MDRTAWIAVTLCVVGLVGWEWWTIKNAPPRPAAVASPTPAPAINTSATPSPLTSPIAAATPAAEAAPTFTEKMEVVRNDDVELHLTNRGGGISEAVLLNQLGQGDQRVVLNSKDQTPIGAIIDQPASPKLEEFTLVREPDGGVRCERNANNIAIRKKFFFPPSKEKKDNFLAEMDVDIANGGPQPVLEPRLFCRSWGCRAHSSQGLLILYTARLVHRWQGQRG